MNNSSNTQNKLETAILVGVEIHRQESLLSLDDSLLELGLLAETAGVSIVGEITQKLESPNPRTYLGSGKVEELKILAEELNADLIIFDDELSPRHQRELEEIVGKNVKIIDRTALILDIFAQHANTREGILQVQLAQYEYRLPRLTRAWTHLARQAGGGGGRTGAGGGVGLRGPGETQLEVDRREIRSKVAKLNEELEKVRSHRARYRSQRKKSETPIVALVGYTNAGKSTLLNLLTNAEVYVADQLFATLDPTTRKIKLPNGQYALLSDTVGFIQKLPTTLVAAFRATLEEIAEADLLLHIIDATHSNAGEQANSVLETLNEIGAGDIPIITVLNKIDLIENPDQTLEIKTRFPNTYLISALQNLGLDDLLKAISDELFNATIPIEVFIPYSEGYLISMFNEIGIIEHLTNQEFGAKIRGLIPKRMVRRYQKYFIDN